MVLFFFTESLLPYLEGLDSWLYDGILVDSFEEVFRCFDLNFAFFGQMLHYFDYYFS